ncbi:Type III restriction enzyme, res subunit family protein [Salinisphaera sp. T5B8]|uniref:helicase-related protein n=1 Tax=Salinisphaera sp. T5B8 TaxID=1304154 RepID=UPI00333F8D80
MIGLAEIHVGTRLAGVVPGETIEVIQASPIGADAISIVYKKANGAFAEQMLFKADEERLGVATAGRPWSLDAPAADFKIALEAFRIRVAHLFDPMMAVHTSNVEPLPHQISAVYEAMLPRQPLRFVLADDPGAGKTIMAGLLIRELIMRADAHRILVVAPGGLVNQWQDELSEKFGLQFEIFSREKQEQSATGNYFDEQPYLIARIDQLSRNEELQQKLQLTEWDLIIVDEAHKLSATYGGNKVHKTKRFLLGEMLGSLCRHFLLMTATPHNGKEEDFQLFMSLLDADRFYGRFREGAHKVDVSDMMRRLVKEELLKFDGKPLFPERRAYTANYRLSDQEAVLYEQVTLYVRNEMNRADRLDGKRKGTVGFALTQLQRRLASSPEAIYQSLRRRRKRLEGQLEEHKLIARGQGVRETTVTYQISRPFELPDDPDELDDALTADEYEQYAEQIVDQATAAATIPELEAEITTLNNLERQAKAVVESGNDRKWEELSSLLQDTPEMQTPSGQLRKLIIFSEHRDTLNYLIERIKGLLGSPEAVVTIHGGVNRDDRRKIQEEFRNNPKVVVLVATDAAGEGINLQNANLMINYDLPWNPNRLEQRFGRIHRIGQTEVCHLWNMVAQETREGSVFQRLFEKLEVERKALGGRVFDILGEAFENQSLKNLLIDAIRSGESPEVRARLDQVIDGALDTKHLKEILRRNALVEQYMSREELFSIKAEMDKAEARKLQPYFIRAFFIEAFARLGGDLRDREPGRYEIKHVPAEIRERDRVIGETRAPVLKRYERICFEKERVRLRQKPAADLVHPAHSLMATVTDLVLEAHRPALNQGTVLVDPNDDTIEPRLLFVIDHRVREAAGDNPPTASRQLHFVTIDKEGQATHGGWAPHLDLEPLDPADQQIADALLASEWLSHGLESMALEHASQQLVPAHYEEVKARRERQADKTLAAVQQRLVKEINYLADRAIRLDEDVKAGKQPRVQPENFRRRAEELTARLQQRRREIEQTRLVVSGTPVVVGCALVLPQGLIAQHHGEQNFSADAAARARVERRAMEAVTQAEHQLGHEVVDVSAEKCGWDVTAQPPERPDGTVPLVRHIEVKGRAKGQKSVTITRNEIMYGLNQGDKFILAIVLVDGDKTEGPYYVQQPFQKELDFGVASSNYELDYLLSKAVPPSQTVQAA